MAVNKQANCLFAERQQLFESGNTFKNPNNQFFPRTQSTPMEAQNKLNSFQKGHKVSKDSAEFKPTSEISSFATFLTEQSSNGNSISQSIPKSAIKTDEKTIATATKEGNIAKGSLKSRLKLSSSKFTITGDDSVSKAFVTPQNQPEGPKEVMPDEVQVGNSQEQQDIKIEALKPLAENKDQEKVEIMLEDTNIRKKLIVEQTFAEPSCQEEVEDSVQKEAETEREEEEKKSEEEAPMESSQKIVRVEIVLMKRVDFAEAVAKLGETLKDRPLPLNLENFMKRQIILERKAGPKLTPNPIPIPRPKPVPDPYFSVIRPPISAEEQKKKDEVNNNVNVWMKHQKAVIDPEELVRREIRFNLSLLTMDNFEIIKEKILQIASASLANCKKVAEFIVENAWTQKTYVKVYAKLCDFLGRSDKLNFEDNLDLKKKKNDFKLHILRLIQAVFDNDSNANLSTKKSLEEMSPEEKSLHHHKKKQRILGNVSFIGELFLEKFIIVGIIRIITNSLIQKYLNEYNEYQKATEKSSNRSYEDTLEGLLKLYEIIGPTVEEKETAKGARTIDKVKSNAVVASFQKILTFANTDSATEAVLPKLGYEEISIADLFRIFNIILNEATLSSRLDSLIKNLIQRRDNNWEAPLSKNQGPKTMKELHEEFEKEQMEMTKRGEEYKEELRKYPTRKR